MGLPSFNHASARRIAQAAWKITLVGYMTMANPTS